MTIKDLIKNHNYPLIELYIGHPKYTEPVFVDQCESKDGKLISLDGDTYSENIEVLSYKTFQYYGDDCLDIIIVSKCGGGL